MTQKEQRKPQTHLQLLQGLALCLRHEEVPVHHGQQTERRETEEYPCTCRRYTARGCVSSQRESIILINLLVGDSSGCAVWIVPDSSLPHKRHAGDEAHMLDQFVRMRG